MQQELSLASLSFVCDNCGVEFEHYIDVDFMFHDAHDLIEKMIQMFERCA